MHSDLTDENQKSIKDFFCEIEWEFIKVPNELFAGFPVTKKYPEQIYYRLAAPLLLPECLERVLYLDVDTIVINSLEELYESDFDNNWFTACTHTQQFLTKLNQLRLGIPADKDVPYINTGVLMINLTLLRKTFKLEDIRSFMEENKRRLWLPDQDILTSLYGDKTKIVNTLKYNINDRIMVFYNSSSKMKIDENWVKENGVIIHYFGKNKPWRVGYEGILGEFYYGLAERLQKRIREYRDEV